MSYENIINSKLAISQIIVRLPRNGLCRRHSKTHIGEASDEQEADDEEDEARAGKCNCVLKVFNSDRRQLMWSEKLVFSSVCISLLKADKDDLRQTFALHMVLRSRLLTSGVRICTRFTKRTYLVIFEGWQEGSV